MAAYNYIGSSRGLQLLILSPTGNGIVKWHCNLVSHRYSQASVRLIELIRWDLNPTSECPNWNSNQRSPVFHVDAPPTELPGATFELINDDDDRFKFPFQKVERKQI